MDIKRAFTYFLEDEAWQNKIALTVVLGLIPIINFAVMGWMMDLIANMLDGKEHPAPDWNDLGGVFAQRWIAGLLTGIAGLLYMIPFIMISICLGITLFMASNEVITTILLSLISIAYTAVMWLPYSVAMMRYAKTRDFNNYIQIGRNIQIARDNMETMLPLIGFIAAITFLIMILGYIPCIGWLLSLLTISAIAIFGGHLTGQAAIIIAQNIRGTN